MKRKSDAVECRLPAGRIDGFAIDPVEESEAAFADRTAAREAGIRTRDASEDRTGSGGMINTHDLTGLGRLGRSVIYGRSRGSMMAGERRGVFAEPMPRHTSEWTTLHVDSEADVLEMHGVTRLRAGKRRIDGIAMNMETGTNPRSHEDAVLASWDGIASSIRLRRTNMTSGAPERTTAARFIQPCLQLDKTVCRSGAVRFDNGRFDDATALKRQSTQSSAPYPIVKPVSMLP